MDSNQNVTTDSVTAQPNGFRFVEGLRFGAYPSDQSSPHIYPRFRPQAPSITSITQSNAPDGPNASPVLQVSVDSAVDATATGASAVPQPPTPSTATSTDPHSAPSSLSTQNDRDDPHSHNRILADYAHLHSEYKRLYYDYKAKEQQLIAKDQTIGAQVAIMGQRESLLATRTQELIALEKKHADVRGSWNEYREANTAYQAEFGRKNQEIAELKQAVAQQKSLADKNWRDAVMYKEYMEAVEQKKNALQAENEKLLYELNQAKYDVVTQKNLVNSWSTQGGANYQKLTKSIEISMEKHFEIKFRRWQEAFVQQHGDPARFGTMPNPYLSQQNINAPPRPNGSRPSSSSSIQAQQSVQGNINAQAGLSRRATLPATSESTLSSSAAPLNSQSQASSSQFQISRPRQNPAPTALDELSAGAFAAAQEAILEPSHSPTEPMPAPQQPPQRPPSAVMTPIQMHSQVSHSTSLSTSLSTAGAPSHIRATPAPSWTVLPDAPEPLPPPPTRSSNATIHPSGQRRVSVPNQAGIPRPAKSPQASRTALNSEQVSIPSKRVPSPLRRVKTEGQDSDSEPDMPLSKRPRTSASGDNLSLSRAHEAQPNVVSSTRPTIVPVPPVTSPVAPAPVAENTQMTTVMRPVDDNDDRMQVEPLPTPIVQGSDSSEPAVDPPVPPAEAVRAMSIIERPGSSMSMSPAVDTASSHILPTIVESSETLAASHDSQMVGSRPPAHAQLAEGTSVPEPAPNAMPIMTPPSVKPDPDADAISGSTAVSFSPNTDVDDEESDIDVILDFLAMSFTYREGDDRVICTLCSSTDSPEGLLVQLSSESDVKYLVEHCRVKHPTETAAALGPASS